jgi:hypothetical protein
MVKRSIAQRRHGPCALALGHDFAHMRRDGGQDFSHD